MENSSSRKDPCPSKNSKNGKTQVRIASRKSANPLCYGSGLELLPCTSGTFSVFSSMFVALLLPPLQEWCQLLPASGFSHSATHKGSEEHDGAGVVHQTLPEHHVVQQRGRLNVCKQTVSAEDACFTRVHGLEKLLESRQKADSFNPPLASSHGGRTPEKFFNWYLGRWRGLRQGRWPR